MDLTITDWNDVTGFLDGYVLDYISIENKMVYGVNSKGSKILLASPAGSYWVPQDGKAYSVVDSLLSLTKMEVKDSGDYSDSNKEMILKNTFERFIKLFHKEYNR